MPIGNVSSFRVILQNQLSFAWGAKTGNEVKREQFAMIDQHEHAEVILMLKRWLSVTPPDAYLCDVGYDKVNALLKEVCRELGLNFSFTPHSPRAGAWTVWVAAPSARSRVATSRPSQRLSRLRGKQPTQRALSFRNDKASDLSLSEPETESMPQGPHQV